MMEKIRKVFFKYKLELIALVLTLVGFIFRINGLWLNYSFWTDEASTARFARGILETGLPKIPTTGYMENSYFVTHYLTALSFKIFGINEFAGRIPEVIFGSLLILATYFFGKKLFNEFVGLGGAALVTFSYIQIAWSRQARGYVILQFFYLLSLLNFYLFIKEKRKINLFLFILFALLAVWTHTLGLIIFPFVGLYLFYERNILKNFFKNKIFLGGLFLFLLFLLFGTNFLPTVKILFQDKILNFKTSGIFVSYYHSLLWRQYSLITFLAMIALVILWIKKEKNLVLFLVLFLATYMFSISFLVGVPFEKYSLPVFPIIFSLASFALWEISRCLVIRKRKAIILFVIFILFIIGNGNKFSLKPRSFYTLNFDMREIPEIDFKTFYSLVLSMMDKKDEAVALVDIHHDMPAWYLGEGKNLFIPRKDVPGERKQNINSGATFIHSLEEFKEVKNRYPRGFVVLTEHDFRFYPEGFVDFVRKNLRLEKKEEYAWFSPDWNRWTIELYSWGFK